MTPADRAPSSARPIEPDELAGLIASTSDSFVLGLDVDGVLAPIVEHADRASLLPGTVELLAALARRIPVAVVSGRSISDLDTRYDFPVGLRVIGSHGLEHDDRGPVQLDAEERGRLERLTSLATAAAREAGSGAWVEHKPASVVLHVREAEDTAGRRAVDQLTCAAAEVDGAHAKSGHEVLELFARATSKATAVARLREELGVCRVVYLGDDHTDEEVFATLGPTDVSVRVGPGATVASYRLPGPEQVQTFLAELDRRLTCEDRDHTSASSDS